jgi:hypothetical protein
LTLINNTNNKVIKAATSWSSNAHMIEDCFSLGYLSQEALTLDPTYGRGGWWKRQKPNTLITHDLANDGINFHNLPYNDNHFDAVVYDPPYVATGGRSTTGIPDFFDRYGLKNAPRTPIDLQNYINKGLTECDRVLTSKGFLLVKCKDYISSGKLWIGTHHTLTHALNINLTLVDRLEYITSGVVQPANRRQIHARRNLSTLFIFKKQ